MTEEHHHPEPTQTKADRVQNMFVIGFTIAVIIFLLAVFFGVKYYYQPRPAERMQYSSFKFEKQDNIWYTLWQRNKNVYKIGLHYNPKEVEKIPFTGELNATTFNTKNKVYITFDPLSDNTTFKHLALAASELSTELAGPLGRYPVAACTRGEQLLACKDRPIITCDNQDLNVIVLKAEEPASVFLNNSCITIQGKDLDLVKAAEKTLYVWFGMIKNPFVYS